MSSNQPDAWLLVRRVIKDVRQRDEPPRLEKQGVGYTELLFQQKIGYIRNFLQQLCFARLRPFSYHSEWWLIFISNFGGCLQYCSSLLIAEVGRSVVSTSSYPPHFGKTGLVQKYIFELETPYIRRCIIPAPLFPTDCQTYGLPSCPLKELRLGRWYTVLCLETKRRA